MTYEQLLELGEKIGKVSRGFNQTEIGCIPTKEIVSEDENHSCAVC